jgi:hypothetical protein
MIRRAIPLSLLVTGLAFFPLTGSCGNSSSNPSASRGSDAGRSSSSLNPSGIWMGGLWDSAVGAESGVPEGGADESGGDVSLSDGESQDAGPDVTISEAGATEAGSDAAGDGDSSQIVTGSAEAGTLDSAVEASACVSLTVLNYEVWCSVTVNAGAAFVADAETLCVPPGTEQLAATALPNFELGPAPWHDTAGDNGDGDPGTVTDGGMFAVNSTTVVVGDAATCVWVCCPFDDGVGCPTTDQCP